MYLQRLRWISQQLITDLLTLTYSFKPMHQWLSPNKSELKSSEDDIKESVIHPLCILIHRLHIFYFPYE
jgi:hypothetical protein